ncbi:PREDICTED: cytochrome P450 4C1-like [Nicrophorus vespilloides]|uniref:Cytochrome P450 4C1-like n=1 Tax=Nicrophorus vespilloides TaxID=110193 RepID=A0ABM1N1M2_NICVS|nr:PREDICTED: cytochrome P450 4C1-like [Nicrophorus vespilloides]
MITAVLVVLLLAFPLIALWKRIRILYYIEKLPGLRAYPLIGTTYQFYNVPKSDIFSTLVKRNLKYGPILRSWLGHRPLVHLMKPAYFEKVMTSQVSLSKGMSYDTVKPWMGNGLLVNTGASWHQRRKLLTPAFHFSILENFVEVFNEKALKLADKLETKVGQQINMLPYITKTTLDIICETAMGIQFNAMDDGSSEYIDALCSVTGLAIMRMLRPWEMIPFIYKMTKNGKRYYRCVKILHEVATQVLVEKKKAYNSKKASAVQETSEEDLLMGKKKRKAFLDLVLEASNGGQDLSDTEIREEIDTFLFAGHDTTSSGICWTLLLLGNHQDWQDKVRTEIEDIMQGEQRPFTMQDLQEMKCLERVIKEQLRIFPNVPVIARMLSEDLNLDGYYIPAGVSINMQIYEAHHDPENWPEPERFDPDRFLPENTKNRHPYSYVPFSAGPRNCIGQKFAQHEQKILLATILRKYRVKAVDKVEDVKMNFEIVIRPHDGLNVILERID